MRGIRGMTFALVALAFAANAVPPRISKFGPQQVFVGQGQTYTLKCRGTGGALAYRWWHQEPDAAQGHAIPYGEGFAVDRPKLAVPDAAPNRDYNGWYWCVVTNTKTGETTTSPRAQVTVIKAPRITQQPRDQRKRLGESALFNVAADPGAPVPVSYQWYRDGRPVSGARQQALNISYVTAGKAGYYSCRVTSPGGTTDSGAAQLAVLP